MSVESNFWNQVFSNWRKIWKKYKDYKKWHYVTTRVLMAGFSNKNMCKTTEKSMFDKLMSDFCGSS